MTGSGPGMPQKVARKGSIFHNSGSLLGMDVDPDIAWAQNPEQMQNSSMPTTKGVSKPGQGSRVKSSTGYQAQSAGQSPMTQFMSDGGNSSRKGGKGPVTIPKRVQANSG